MLVTLMFSKRSLSGSLKVGIVGSRVNCALDLQSLIKSKSEYLYFFPRTQIAIVLMYNKLYSYLAVVAHIFCFFIASGDGEYLQQ